MHRFGTLSPRQRRLGRSRRAVVTGCTAVALISCCCLTSVALMLPAGSDGDKDRAPDSTATPVTSSLSLGAVPTEASGQAGPTPPVAAATVSSPTTTPADQKLNPSNTQPSLTQPTVPVVAKTTASTAIPASTPATVVRVVDGDTIDVRINGAVDRVRLIGIDAPETGSGRTVVECFGSESTAFLKQLIEGRPVTLATDPSQDTRDRYDRLLAYVWLADGTFVNEVLIAEGYAHEYTYDEPYQYRDRFRAAYVAARDGTRGLWAPDTCGGVAAIGGAAAAPGALGAGMPAATPAALAAGLATVVIADVRYDGVVPEVESDEVAIVANVGSASVNLTGWRLNAGYPGQDFVFPATDLAPGQSCYVYTNQLGPEPCSFSFGSETAIWNNKGDCGYLFDAAGSQVAEYCYPR